MIDCRVVVDEDEFAQCAAIRLEVFVDEQRVPADEELDDLDAISVHVLARVDGGPVGTGRLIPTDDGRGKIGRMVVRKRVRGSGVCAPIMDPLWDVARERGMDGLTLSAPLST